MTCIHLSQFYLLKYIRFLQCKTGNVSVRTVSDILADSMRYGSGSLLDVGGSNAL